MVNSLLMDNNVHWKKIVFVNNINIIDAHLTPLTLPYKVPCSYSLQNNNSQISSVRSFIMATFCWNLYVYQSIEHYRL